MLYFNLTAFTTHLLKGQSNEIFDLQSFHHSKPAWATDQWVKIFSMLIKISLSYLNCDVEKTDSPQYYIILQ